MRRTGCPLSSMFTRITWRFSPQWWTSFQDRAMPRSRALPVTELDPQTLGRTLRGPETTILRLSDILEHRGCSLDPRGPTMSDDPNLQSQYEAEHTDFVALARGLTDQQWESRSLCEQWTVHDVVIHVAWHIHRDRSQVPAFLLHTLMSGPTKAAAQAAVSEAARHDARSPDKLLEWLASPGTAGRVNLAELMIHQQDVRRPLSISRTIPEDRLSSILDYCLSRTGSATVVPGARKRATGLRLTATNMEWSAGDGPEVRGSGEALLMVINGRASALDDLTGPGVSTLASRLSTKRS